MFDDLRDLYQDAILDRARAPRHRRRLELFDASARGDNPMCGDRVELRLRRDDAGRIAEVGFEARGCHISIAAADLLSEAVLGHTPAEIATLDRDFRDMVRTGAPGPETLETLRPLSGVHEFPSRQKCATLVWDALRAALEEASHG
jgi:nitrogen fixation NifU-like protein